MRAFRLACLPVALIGLMPSAGVAAQTPYPAPAGVPSPYPSPYAVQPITDADLLASAIRALAANPLDLDALVHAGELAVRIGDVTAAGTFFARAERIDPRNARVKAAEGSLLVATERPGEALRRFAEAATLGGDVRSFAADRGLAYDLVGEQDRAQRDYRLALRSAPNDETQRRYALSLGIAGKRELALAQIDSLLRKSDRGAWRARAFILAMAGDGGGAERIATSMMPAGLSEGLQPFFVLLPTLGPADRAFAVHFGEVRTTPERQFDARLVPPLETLPPDPTAPVLAAATKPAPVARENRRRQRKRDRDRIEVAAAAPPPQPIPPSYRPPPAAVQSAPTVAMNAPTQQPAPQPAILSARTAPAPAVALPRPAPAVVSHIVPAVVQGLPAAARMAGTDSTVRAVSGVSGGDAPATVARPSAAPIVSPPAVAAVAVPQASPVAAPLAPRPVPVRSEESILASILADIKVPPSELEGSAVEAAAVPSPAPNPALAARAEAEHTLADRKAADQKAAETKKIADRKAADKKLADKKLADAKALADKKAAEEKKRHDPKLLEPSRIWVQVAGGATEHDLAKEWTRVRGKATAAFKGKQGWTTPLRATNRVLTGPFDSEDDAQAFVNVVAKSGISAFVFTSEAGQKIAKLPAK